MRGLLRASTFIDACNRRLAQGVGWLTLLMVLVGAYNALARWLERDLGLQLSSNAYLEAQWYLFSLVFLLGAPYALRCGAHVRVDVVYGGLPRRAQYWVDLVGGLLFLIPFCVFAIWSSYHFVVDSWIEHEMSNDPGGLPRWLLKPVVPLAFFLLALQGLSEVVKRWALLRGVDVPLSEGGEGGAG